MNRNREQELDQLRHLHLSGSTLSLAELYKRIQERERELAPTSWIVAVVLLLLTIVGTNWAIAEHKSLPETETISLSVGGLLPENSIYEGGDL